MLKRNGWLAMVLAAVCVLAVVAVAQDKSIRRLEPGRKMALVIGNAAYTTQRQLTNPVNDAQAVARLLREELGFAEEHVQLRLDLETGRSINQALDGFAKELQGTDLAFFYYSGHGGQEGESRENYLLPTGFEAVEKEDLEYDALAVTKVLKRLAKAQLRVVVVDACRTNRGLVKDRKTGGVPGLAAAEIDPDRLGDMRGELIAYAASAGQVATDQGKGVGLYARHLVAELGRPGVEFRQAFQRVRDAVRRETEQKQNPMLVHQLYGAEFYFAPREEPPLVADWVTDWQVLEPLEKSKDPDGVPTVKEYIEKYKGEPRAGVWVRGAERLLSTLEEDVVVPSQEWTNSLGMEFVWIKAGSFERGIPMGFRRGMLNVYDDGSPLEVRIDEGFWMGKYEVTQEEWEELMGANPSRFKSCPERCPVETVSPDDVQEYVQKLNERESESGYEYRLPTEEEWEYAARAGIKGVTPEGDPPYLEGPAWYEGVTERERYLGGQAWYGGNSGVSYLDGEDCGEGEQMCGTHPVGQKRANAWGLYDMLGNVGEWTSTREGGTVDRGGSWTEHPNLVRFAPIYDDDIISDKPRRYNYIGFRLLRAE